MSPWARRCFAPSGLDKSSASGVRVFGFINQAHLVLYVCDAVSNLNVGELARRTTHWHGYIVWRRHSASGGGSIRFIPENPRRCSASAGLVVPGEPALSEPRASLPGYLRKLRSSG